jgi:hypothetical protein
VSGDEQKASPGSPAALSEGLTPRLRHAADLSALTEPKLRRALDWWQGLRDGPRQIPDRARLDPTAIPDLLPNAILWDVLPAPDTDPRPGAAERLYRCRLAGTLLNDFYGREARGLWLNEQFGDESAAMQEDYDTVVRLRRPFCTEHRMSWAGKPYYKYQRLMLPFTDRMAAQRSDSPALRADPDRVALLFNVVSFIGE